MTFGIALLLAAAPIPRELADAGDESAARFTQCLFAQSRQAHSANLSVAEFRRRLSAQCLVEERALAAVSSRIDRLRGEPGQTVQLIAGTRRGVVEAYRSALMLGEQQGGACATDPQACKR